MEVQKILDPRKTKPVPPDELRRWLRRIEWKIDVLVDGMEKKRVPRRAEVGGIGEALDVMALLSLPDHLRKSALIIVKLGKAMAEDVAKETGRARAIESAYLNQLVRMGYLKRVREGKRVYFWVEGNSGGTKYPRTSGRGGPT